MPRALELTAEQEAEVGKANGRVKRNATGVGAYCQARMRCWRSQRPSGTSVTGVARDCLACVLLNDMQRASGIRRHGRCSLLPLQGWTWKHATGECREVPRALDVSALYVFCREICNARVKCDATPVESLCLHKVWLEEHATPECVARLGRCICPVSFPNEASSASHGKFRECQCHVDQWGEW